MSDGNAVTTETFATADVEVKSAAGEIYATFPALDLHSECAETLLIALKEQHAVPMSVESSQLLFDGRLLARSAPLAGEVGDTGAFDGPLSFLLVVSSTTTLCGPSRKQSKQRIDGHANCRIRFLAKKDCILRSFASPGLKPEHVIRLFHVKPEDDSREKRETVGETTVGEGAACVGESENIEDGDDAWRKFDRGLSWPLLAGSAYELQAEGNCNGMLFWYKDGNYGNPRDVVLETENEYIHVQGSATDSVGGKCSLEYWFGFCELTVSDF